jgi:integrase/recombinase XerD
LRRKLFSGTQGEDFFMNDLLRVRFFGPLKPFAPGFAKELSRQGYTRNSACMQMRLVAHLSRWLEGEGLLDLQTLRQVEVDRFIHSRRASGYTLQLTEKALQPILSHLRRLGAVPLPPVAAPDSPVDVLLERYRNYLTTERGLGGPTTRGYVEMIRPFLQSRISPDGLDLELDISAADVTAFVVARCPKLSRSPAKLTVTALRSLLGFLHIDGVITRSLAAAVPSVAGWRLAGLPKGLNVVEVRRLLISCDRRTSTGRRDYAVMMVLACLGLRAGEVAGLQLDDFDWRAGTLVVRGKGNRVERLPLPADVGDAIAAYLRRGRPADALGRAVFIRVKAPHSALTSGGVTQLVAAAASRAGLGQIFAHRLRHTLATQMLRAGSSLREVGQVLRHRRALTTAIYAKVNRDALRTVARPWPGSAA